ncbi:MAG: hypothetical protein ABR512_05100 [Desulfopila sp.]
MTSQHLLNPHTALPGYCAVVLFILLCTSHALARDSAKVQYINASGKNVVFTVTVTAPAPGSLIIQHSHDPANKLINATPQARQIDNSSGTAKWLIPNVRPGRYTFSLTFAGAVRTQNMHAALRYRTPGSGAFREHTARP